MQLSVPKQLRKLRQWSRSQFRTLIPASANLTKPVGTTISQNETSFQHSAMVSKAPFVKKTLKNSAQLMGTEKKEKKEGISLEVVSFLPWRLEGTHVW